jgi:hypothetical protein
MRRKQMKMLGKLEELALFALSLYLRSLLPLNLIRFSRQREYLPPV